MLLRELDRQLDRVAARLRTERLLWHGAALTLVVAAILLTSRGLSTLDATTRRTVVASLLLAASVPAIVLVRSALRRRPRLDVARRIEGRFPDLRACLLTAVDQAKDRTSELGILQRQVVYDALAHARHNDWRQTVTTRRLLGALSVQVTAIAIPVLALLIAGPSGATPLAGSTNEPASARIAVDLELTVDPGDATLERGTSLPILARFAKGVPGAATLVVETADGRVQPFPLTKSLDDPVFGGRLPEAQHDLKYRIEYDGRTSRDYQVKVFDYPTVLQADATIAFPEWTGLPETKLEEVHRVSVPEGATLTLACRLNKNVDTVLVKDDDGTVLGGMKNETSDDHSTLTPSPHGFAGGEGRGEGGERSKASANSSSASARLETPAPSPPAPLPRKAGGEGSHVLVSPTEMTFACALKPKRSGKWRVELKDADGRTSREPFELIVEVVPNRRPELKVNFPARDVRVSPIEELALEGTAWDDFGLVEYGLVYNVAGRPPVVVPLGRDHTGREPQTLSHLVALEDLKVEPDELVSWHFYADDRAPDGAIRRTVGDMFFAEVRHFEEIFRQGQAPPGGGGGPQGGGGENEQKAEQLAEQQKQIATATWNVMRKGQAAPSAGDTRAKHLAGAASVGGTVQEAPTLAASAMGPLAEDLRLLHDSQQKLAAQAAEFGQKLRDAKSQQFLKTAVDQMQHAATALEKATTANTLDVLPDALVAEQSAYQALLKLRAREHNVVEQQGGGGSGGGGSGRSQQQLQQLELTNQQNRYQTDKQAKSEATDPAKREQLQVLNRLRELARRQADVNEKLRDLERALRDAKTEAEQAEIQRQLKRLRDEQQQALRDVDELRDRMDRPENQREMSESREQLDQARDRIRQTSEALKEGQVSKALSSGVRSERDLDKLREDFRKKTAHKFADDMNRLRTQARDLASKEDAIRRQLQPDATAAKEPRKSLRAKNENEAAGKALAEQKEKLNELLDGMKRVVEQSEASEPLLSKQLYDTARTAREHQPAEQLDAAAKSLRQNRPDEAAQAEAQARKGIDSLRKGIERAADSVLGDETESLRRASKELSDLTRAVDKESAAKSGRQPLQTADASGSERTKNDERGTKNEKSRAGSNSKPDESPKPGDKPGAGAKPSDSEGKGQSGSQPGNEPGDQPGDKGAAGDSDSEKGANSDQPGQGDSSDKPGSSSDGKSSSGSTPGGSGSGSEKPGHSKSGSKPNESRQASRLTPSRGSQQSGSQGGGSGGAGEGPGSPLQPLTGRDFQEWSDRLRDVEEMLSDSQLKSDVARIRDRARTMRAEFKRHSQEPNWELVRTQIVEPLTELQLRVAEDLARRESKDSLTPIDRDPVPDRYSDLVKRYYERLGK